MRVIVTVTVVPWARREPDVQPYSCCRNHLRSQGHFTSSTRRNGEGPREPEPVPM
jgi:hypothetical protein